MSLTKEDFLMCCLLANNGQQQWKTAREARVVIMRLRGALATTTYGYGGCGNMGAALEWLVDQYNPGWENDEINIEEIIRPYKEVLDRK